MVDRTIIEGGGSSDAVDRTMIEPAGERTVIESRKPAEAESKASAFVGLVKGAKIGGCRLESPIREASGEADLWIGTRESDGRKVVLKVYKWGIRPKEEIRAKVAEMERAHVVELLGHGQLEDERHYEVLEYIEHGTLAQWSQDGLSGEQVKAVLRELADAVAALHAVQIIHRDLKPANVLVRSKDPLDLVLADFGISSLAELSLHKTSLNRTVAYGAPESLTGVIGKASDWWSVGVMALELLTRRRPFEGMSEQVMNFALATRGIEVPVDIPDEWQLLLKGLLTRDPAKRWGMEQVHNWLAGRRDMTVRYEGPDITYGAEAQRPYKLGEQEYRTAAELGKAIAENWAEGAKHLARGLLTSWVKDDVKNQNKASQLMDMVEDKKLTGEMKAGLAGMVLAESVPLTWKGEIVNRDWLVGHTDEAVRILESTLPEWVQRLRGEPWLCEMRAWREKVLSRMKSAIVSYDKRLVDQMVVSSVEAVEAVAVEVAKTYVASTDSELERLLHEKSLSLEDAILLVACDRKLLLTEAQRREREIRAMAQKRGIKVDDELMAKAACLEGEALQEAVSKLRAKHVDATVEALGSMLRAEALSDQDARIFLACDRAQLLTEKQDRERKVKELASKHKIELDRRFLSDAVKLEGEQLSVAWGKLCNTYVDATNDVLRGFLHSESLSDHEVRLLLACDSKQLVTKDDVVKLDKRVAAMETAVASKQWDQALIMSNSVLFAHPGHERAVWARTQAESALRRRRTILTAGGVVALAALAAISYMVVKYKAECRVARQAAEDADAMYLTAEEWKQAEGQYQAATKVFAIVNFANVIIRARRATKGFHVATIHAVEKYKLEMERRNAEAKQHPGKEMIVDLGGGVKMEFVWCPPGAFLMGSPFNEEGRSSHETLHRVTLTKGFWLGKYEVTQEQWERVMNNHPTIYKHRKHAPVDAVSLKDCEEFIRKLNADAGGRFRMPTEAEWEYACRAGTTTLYNTGDSEADLDRAGWYILNSLQTIYVATHLVGLKVANAWGLYDMHGNVQEWCADIYDKYPSGAVIDPAGPTSYGEFYIQRGGDHSDKAYLCRSASRDYTTPSSDFGGFRCARDQ